MRRKKRKEKTLKVGITVGSNRPYYFLERRMIFMGNLGQELHDSGDRREFNTGAVRDMAEGKGRFDLLPACAIMRLARHYEAGASKYDARNWEKGIPISVMIDSALRHLMKYMDGQTDEDHLVAATWNLMGAMWMEEKKPELQDLPSRKKHTL